MTLSVIIINYNVKYFLEQCLFSVLKSMHLIDGEIIVIDNNSTDDSFSFFQNKFPDVNFVWNQSNVGFAKANNQGLSMATGEYILFLNPDTLLPEDCLEQCIAFIKNKNNNLALGIKMLDGSGRFLKESKRAFPGPLTSLYKLTGLAKFFPHSKTFSRYHLGYLNEDENHEVDVLAGAFIMVPKKIVNEINGFDEDFFMYGEDIDFSFRIQKAGYKNFYFAHTPIIHFKGESTKKGSLNYVKMFYKAMSIFVKKHYGGSRAGLFNLLIQFAILIRAFLAATARFLKWIGLPVIDASIILLSFYLIKVFWSANIKQEVNYSPNMLLIAFPAFTFLFLISSWLSGLYDNGFKQSRLNKSTLISIMVILAVYSLLPEKLRFSRGILLFGSLLAFFLMTTIRQLLIRWKIIESVSENDHNNLILIVATDEEFEEVKFFFEKRKIDNVVGKIAPDEIVDSTSIGTFDQINDSIQSYSIDEIIFCTGTLSFKKTIDSVQKIPKNVSIKFFTPGGHTIIGSDDRNTGGEIISREENYRLNNAVYRRTKLIFDFTLSCLFLITFPVHLILKKRPLTFFKNCLKVFSGKNTWVGYARCENALPPLKKGIITSTGLPHSLNTLPKDNLQTADKLYAKYYHILNDLQLIWKHYQLLS